MAELSNILDRRHARKAIEYHLGDLLVDLFPTRKMMIANKGYVIPDQEYITVRARNDTSTNDTGLGVISIHSELDDAGNKTQIYQSAMRFIVKWHKGDANDDACYFAERIKDADYSNKWFNEDVTLEENDVVIGVTTAGITNISGVDDSPTSIEFGSNWEEGSVITFTINYLFRVYTENTDVIEQIDFTATTKTEDGEFVLDGSAQNP